MESKALTLGISTNEIRNRLNENYSFDDIDAVCEKLRSYNIEVKTGVFGADMKIELINDGPVTIIYDEVHQEK